jgi:hypothetical protein
VFFQHLYTQDPAVCPQPLMQCFEPCITEEMNVELCKDFTGDEIADVLFQIGPLEVLDLMVFQPDFFKGTGEW